MSTAMFSEHEDYYHALKFCTRVGAVASGVVYSAMNAPHLINQIQGEFSNAAYWSAVISNTAVVPMAFGAWASGITDAFRYSNAVVNTMPPLNSDELPLPEGTSFSYFVGTGGGVLATLAASFVISTMDIQHEPEISQTQNEELVADVGFIPKAN